MKKDLYKILGVNREANPDKIKRAYRVRAKQYHPDISPEEEERFKEIQNAYETLSDPEKRSNYDRELLHGNAQDYWLRDPPRTWDTIIGFFDQPSPLFSVVDDFWGQTLLGFFNTEMEEPGQLFVEITLSPEEAREGGEIFLDVPFWVPCRRCQGTGNVWGLICGYCRGQGEVRPQERISVVIPSRARDGMKMTIRLDTVELGGIDVVVTIRVT